MQLISIIFSFRNEEKNLDELIERVTKTLNKLNNYKYELIFVNDDSTDNSEKILTEYQKKYPIIIINMSRKFGRTQCMLAGLNNANGDCAICIDSDLQDPPELIEKMVNEYEKGFDVVHTVRKKRLGEPWHKILLTSLAYKIINSLSNINLPAESGDYKLISKRALKKILEQNEHRPYLRGLLVWVGFKQTFIEYVREGRKSGKSKFPVFSEGPITEFISGVTGHSLRPLYLGIVLGFFSICLSLILIIYALYLKFSNLSVPGSAGIIIVTSFFSGIILLFLGIIGIYLSKIFEQTQGRDRYIIREIKKKVKN